MRANAPSGLDASRPPFERSNNVAAVPRIRPDLVANLSSVLPDVAIHACTAGAVIAPSLPPPVYRCDLPERPALEQAQANVMDGWDCVSAARYVGIWQSHPDFQALQMSAACGPGAERVQNGEDPQVVRQALGITPGSEADRTLQALAGATEDVRLSPEALL